MLAPESLETGARPGRGGRASSGDAARAKLGLGGDGRDRRRRRSRWPRRSPGSTSPTTSGPRVVYDLSWPPATPGRRRALVAALVPDLLRSRRPASSSRTAHLTTEQAEERVERQAREFELLKPYLIEVAGTAVPRPADPAGPAGATSPRRGPRRRGPGRHRNRGPPRHAQGGRRMMGEPLPARILIPVANPATAEELIRTRCRRCSSRAAAS